MGLVSEIRGLIGAPRRGRPSTRQPAATTVGRIAEIEAALGRLQREREAASQAIATASERRRELLLRDAPDGEVEKLERDTDRRHRDLERLELLETDLLRQLSDKRDVARSAEWNGRFAELCDSSTSHLEAARHALLRLAQLVQRIDQARAAGFEAEAHAFVGLAPQMLAADLLDSFEAELERLRDRHSAAPLRRSALQPCAV